MFGSHGGESNWERSMEQERTVVYPYIPNSVPAVRENMLEEIGVESVDDLYSDIPDELRLKRAMNLPKPFLSEYDLRKHVTGILAWNRTTQQVLNFLGAGCYQHSVPAVCDEVNRRGEFLTAYAGEPYDDHGRFQALFEYASMMGELLNMDVVNVPTYDGFQAAATSVRMAARITGRRRILLSGSINPGKLSKILDYCQPGFEFDSIGCDPLSGQLDLDDLADRISSDTAAIFFENPSFLGLIEGRGGEIASIAHEHGALCIVSADPISLGVLKPPADYGADIVCGDIQSLGMHMQFGGGHAGYIATRDKEEYVAEYPSRLFGIAPTSVDGEYGFGDVAYERTSFAVREQGKEWVGTGTALWGITAGVYLALMGPQGMAEIGEGIMARTRYAMMQMEKIEEVTIPFAQSAHFREFVVSFDGVDLTVGEVNKALLEMGILGGADLTTSFPEFGRSALYCVTEVHTKADIDQLVSALQEVTRG